jgi:Uma2 family endonuclease
MSAIPKQRYTPEEYLAIERNAEYKSEYLNGEIFAMSGASRKHNLISGNVYAALHGQLRKRKCEIYTGDMLVMVNDTGLYTYPDIAIVCDAPRFDDDMFDILLNPQVIIEVLSKSTESYDRGAKFAHYRTIDSLSDYLLISQDKLLVEHYIRHEKKSWLLSEYVSLEDVIRISSVGCELAIADMYEKTGI